MAAAAPLMQHRGMRRLSFALTLIGLSCLPPLGGPGLQPDGGLSDGGPQNDGGSFATGDAGALQWQWVAVPGSVCGSGSTAGFGLAPSDSSDELLIFFQGGGACWNTGTCVPSLVQYGPACDYGQLCVLDVEGGQRPTASHVTEKDPFPADGGGSFAQEVAALSASRLLDRSLPDNPLRRANVVYVPYCTGDLHAGNAVRSYQYKYNLLDQPSTFQMHFAGATNVERYLEQLVSRFTQVRRVWVMGVSGGAYGATLNFDRIVAAFPNAEVHLLADSGPLLSTPHWADWRDTWAMKLRDGCTACDAGFDAVIDDLLTRHASRRIGLLSYDADKVIAWFFYAPPGASNLLQPPLGTFANNLNTLLPKYSSANARAFVVTGEEHVLIGGYGSRLADGGYSAPVMSRDGGTNLRDFVDGWVKGDGRFTDAR